MQIEIEASKVLDTLMEVETQLKYIFEPDEVTQTVHDTVRKCQNNGKDTAYFYLLLADELRDCLMRKQINYLGAQNASAI